MGRKKKKLEKVIRKRGRPRKACTECKVKKTKSKVVNKIKTWKEKKQEKQIEPDDFFKPSPIKEKIKRLKVLGYCRCGFMITTSDKQGHRYLCHGCGKLVLKSKLRSEYVSKEKGIELDEDFQVIHNDLLILNDLEKYNDIENPHLQVLKEKE